MTKQTKRRVQEGCCWFGVVVDFLRRRNGDAQVVCAVRPNASGQGGWLPKLRIAAVATLELDGIRLSVLLPPIATREQLLGGQEHPVRDV